MSECSPAVGVVDGVVGVLLDGGGVVQDGLVELLVGEALVAQPAHKSE